MIHEKQLISNATGRKYLVTDIKDAEVHRKLQN